MKVYDCFTFFNELDILEIRLKELYNVVDYFVIVEANKTFSGNKKEFILEKSKERYKQWWDKIIYIKVENLPELIFNSIYLFLASRNSSAIKSLSYELKIGPWRLENFQRNQIIQGLTNAKDEDIIIISDLDEIPSKKSVQKSKTLLKNYERIILNMKDFRVYYNYQLSSTWVGTKFVKFKTLRDSLSMKPQNVRTSFKEKFLTKILKKEFLKDKIIFEGWHFSWIGNDEIIQDKLKNTSHQEKNKQKRKFEEELFKGGYKLKMEDKHLPVSLRDLLNKNKIKKFILK